MGSFLGGAGMKRLIFSLLLAVSICLSATTQETFLRGNHLYKQKQFEQALTTYQEIKQKSSAVWYNIGNCYYCLKNYPQALWAWRKAQKTNSTSSIYQKAQQQINNVALLLGVQDQEKKIAIQTWSQTSLGMLQLIFLISWVLFFSLIIWYTYCRKKKTLVLLAGLNMLCVGTILYTKYYQAQTVTAICTDQICLHAGPQVQYPIVGTLKKGSEVIIKEQQQTWCKVKQGSVIGWIEHNNEALSMV